MIRAVLDRLPWKRIARLEAEKAELIRILQELERRCQVVVNREVSNVLKGVPSWKSEQAGETEETGKKPARFRGGMRTWREKQQRLERKHSEGSRRLERRVQEFKEVLGGNLPQGSSDGAV